MRRRRGGELHRLRGRAMMWESRGGSAQRLREDGERGEEGGQVFIQVGRRIYAPVDSNHGRQKRQEITEFETSDPCYWASTRAGWRNKGPLNGTAPRTAARDTARAQPSVLNRWGADGQPMVALRLHIRRFGSCRPPKRGRDESRWERTAAQSILVRPNWVGPTLAG